MKKILIFSHAMELGGAERALLGLLENIDTEKYDVDLFLMRHSGELLKFIPPKIHLLEEIPAYAALAIPVKKVLRQRKLGLAVRRCYGKAMAKRRTKQLHYPAKNGIELEYSHKFTWKVMPKIQPDKEYDLAISFLTPHYMVAEKVNARKKVAWIHTDYSAIRIDENSEFHMWSQYDKIIAISQKTAESFWRVFPTLQDKVTIIENIQPFRLIEKQKKAFSVEEEMPADSIRLLSVGRFGYAKNFDNVPEICALLRKSGLNVKWYLIGYGSDEKLIRDNIRRFGMEKFVIILGKKENPYPYMNACDVYVQPSRYEGNCVAVCEAQLLSKPVVVTDYPTARNQIENGIDGVIVPMDIEGCATGICSFLKNKVLMQRIVKTCHQRDYSNSREIEKIDSLMS